MVDTFHLLTLTVEMEGSTWQQIKMSVVEIKEKLILESTNLIPKFVLKDI